MAAKQYIDLADLTLFKQLNDSATAQAIATAEARSLHTVSIDGTTLNFYREEEPVGSATPAYSITLPQQDLSNYLQKIANATGSKVVLSKADGTIEESAYTVADLVLETEIAAVAKSGAAEDVSVADEGGYFTSGNVEGALAELAQASAGGVASKTVWFQDESAGQSDYAKVYKLYQGANAPDAQTDPAALVGTINIPKDLVVQSGSVVVNPSGQPAGTYIELVIQNQDEPLYINVADLVDDYSAAQGATQVQLAISATNEISATLVAGGVGATELASNAVTTVKIADDAVTNAKIADDAVGTDQIVDEAVTEGKLSQEVQAKLNAAVGVTSVVEGTTNGTVSVTTDGVTADVAVHGLGSAAYTAATAYDTAGAAATAKSEVIGAAGDASTANTIYGAKAYADAVAGEATEAVPAEDIRALFNGPSI